MHENDVMIYYIHPVYRDEETQSIILFVDWKSIVTVHRREIDPANASEVLFDRI